jgi:hypothetical protein
MAPARTEARCCGAKQLGFSDKAIAKLRMKRTETVRSCAKRHIAAPLPDRHPGR